MNGAEVYERVRDGALHACFIHAARSEEAPAFQIATGRAGQMKT
jgi:hypothetical protein